MPEGVFFQSIVNEWLTQEERGWPLVSFTIAAKHECFFIKAVGLNGKEIFE
jgi:hypothetical protein